MWREGFSRPSGHEPEREGEISELGLQASLSYPGIMARSGLVIIVILFAHRGLAWRDATVPAAVALLAWR
jgi:hypothetical protein